ncbi:tRNA-dihydrouridine synthase [Candidatus Saccharibacteria bacterium]|nr:tRNA-dihydrouridine synthase [Candidatus Saccharibacteria bacterium]
MKKFYFYDPSLTYEENYERGPFVDIPKSPPPATKPREFLGFRVNSTIGIPAGPLLNANFVEAALALGYDLPVYKTVRSRAQKSNSWPNIIGVEIDGQLRNGDTVRAVDTIDQNITNSFGVPSFEPEIWQPDMKKAVQAAGDGQVVIGSFQWSSGQGIEDYGVTARLVAETGAKIIEANLSCPNEGTANLLCFDIDRVTAVVKAVRSAVSDRPLILKLAYFADDNALRRLVEAVGRNVQGLAAVNTIPARVVTADGQPALGEGREISGVCGQAIKWAGLDMTERLKNLRAELGLDFVIMASGGIMNAGDAKEYYDRGADAVMSATGAMIDPMLAHQIKEKS